LTSDRKRRRIADEQTLKLRLPDENTHIKQTSQWCVLSGHCPF